MGRMENIEYYSNCPSCGAPRGRKDVCDYCGASLIKKMSFEGSVYDSLEEQFEDEDVNLPIINGKSCNKDSFSSMFMLIFGAAFLAFPLFIGIALVSSGQADIGNVLFLLLFCAVGIGCIIPGIKASINRSKCRKGIPLKGEIRGYENGTYMVNGHPVQTVKILVYPNSIPKIVKIKTSNSIRPYPVGSEVTIRNYADYYLIEEKKDELFS